MQGGAGPIRAKAASQQQADGPANGRHFSRSGPRPACACITDRSPGQAAVVQSECEPGESQAPSVVALANGSMLNAPAMTPFPLASCRRPDVERVFGSRGTGR